MKQPHDILAIDLATIAGWARGTPGTIPKCGIVKFGDGDASASAVFAGALRWFSTFLKSNNLPTAIMLESMLPPGALKGETNRAARDRLAGLHGVIRAVAHCRGVYDIGEVDVLAVRRHFCGASNVGKHVVYERCRTLGYPVNDLNASDACAIWSYACGIVEPKTGIAITPLFSGRPYKVMAGAGSRKMQKAEP
jgi:hypothetical protein